MHGKLSRSLIESTLIRMLSETLWVYERGSTQGERWGGTQRSAAAPAAHLSSVFQVHGVSQAHMHGASHARALARSSGFLLCVHLAFRDDCQTEHEADSSRLQFLFSFF